LYSQVVAIPLHIQIADDLRGRIASGDLSVGDPLPSEANLGAQWRGSRGPVRQALATLRAEGLIGGGPGKPPVVRRPARPVSERLVSFTAWADSMGRTAGQRTLELALRPAPAGVAAALGIEAGVQVVQLLRVRLLDGTPAMIERTTLLLDYGRALFEHDLDAGSIHTYLASLGLSIGASTHVLDATVAGPADAALLQLTPGAPLLRQRRITRTVDGPAFEYADERYRGDRLTLTVENQPDAPPVLGRAWSGRG
jgi:GntR family transcriptional regulator